MRVGNISVKDNTRQMMLVPMRALDYETMTTSGGNA